MCVSKIVEFNALCFYLLIPMFRRAQQRLYFLPIFLVVFALIILHSLNLLWSTGSFVLLLVCFVIIRVFLSPLFSINSVFFFMLNKVFPSLSKYFLFVVNVIISLIFFFIEFFVRHEKKDTEETF